MIGKAKFFILLLLFPAMNCYGQELSNYVVVPAAGVATAGVISYSQSVGEPAVEILTSTDIVLTQGFQQPGVKEVLGLPPDGTGVNVYPNPATDYINVKLFGDKARKFKIEVINLTGVIMYSITLDFTSKYYYIQQIDVMRLKFGIYFVKVVSDDRVIDRVFKIEKM
jgi:hypothetical protein